MTVEKVLLFASTGLENYSQGRIYTLMVFFKKTSLNFLVGLSIFCASFSMAQNNAFRIENIAKFDHPWALEFLPDQKILLTEMGGSLKFLDNPGQFLSEVIGVPDVA